MNYYIPYLFLLGFWLPLLWTALRTKGGLRLWLLFVAALGLAASAYEARMWFLPAEAIRIDILLAAPLLAGLFAVSALLLFLARWRRFATVYGLALLMLCGAAAYGWWDIEREQERFVEGRALVAQAGFRSQQTYERRFGPFAPAVQGLPVGHWQPDEESFVSRLIINGRGQVWLFRSFRGVETLDLTSGRSVLQRQEGDDTTWTAELGLYDSAYSRATVTVVRQDAGHLTLSLRGSSANFTKTPPPIRAAPERQDLHYLGSFGAVECDGHRVELAQVWLWRDEVRLYAVGVLQAFAQSRQPSITMPFVWGAASERGGIWQFEWKGMSGDSHAEVTFGEDQIVMAVRQGASPERQLHLNRGQGFLAGDMVDLAPLTSAEDWQHWFSVVPLGNLVTGQTPAC